MNNDRSALRMYRRQEHILRPSYACIFFFLARYVLFYHVIPCCLAHTGETMQICRARCCHRIPVGLLPCTVSSAVHSPDTYVSIPLYVDQYRADGSNSSSVGSLRSILSTVTNVILFGRTWVIWGRNRVSTRLLVSFCLL
jgi:hypothetical protein